VNTKLLEVQLSIEENATPHRGWTAGGACPHIVSLYFQDGVVVGTRTA